MPARESPITMDAALVLLSGGMDSTTLLHRVKHHHPEAALRALSLHYGQRHARELEMARWQAEKLGVPHETADLSFLGGLVAPGTTLVTGGGAVPELAELPEATRDQPPTYVPNRNMILLAIAAAHAEAHGIFDIFYGAQAQDEYGYWDCTTEFIERMNDTLALNRRQPVRVHAPFAHTRKADIVGIGLDLGVDFAHTWTCYRGGERPCGVCPACVEREAAFHEAGEPDPLLG